MTFVKCNICGNDFNDFDEASSVKLIGKIGYGSKYDGYFVDCDICLSCLDKMLDDLAEKCKYSILKEKDENDNEWIGF